MRQFRIFSVSLFLFAACASDLKPEPGPETTDRMEEEGVTEINATGKDWVYFSFARNEQIKVQDAQASRDWDLGFQSFMIKINGGVSGAVGLQIAVAAEPYESLAVVPAGLMYATDKQGTDPMMDPGLAFATLEEGWFDYDMENHKATPKPNRAYVIDTGRVFYKLQILEYFRGQFKFRYAALPTQ